MRVGKIMALAMVMGLGLGWANNLSPEEAVTSKEVITKAVREGHSVVSCACESSAEWGSIEECICHINSKIDELFVDFQETWTAIEAISTGTCDITCDLSTTWTILGDYTEPAVGGIDTLDEINTSTLSIIAWLKTIYASSIGVI